MCELTPKISMITIRAPRGFPAGSARYAENLWPSAAVSWIVLPIAFSFSVGQSRAMPLALRRGEGGRGRSPHANLVKPADDALPAVAVQPARASAPEIAHFSRRASCRQCEIGNGRRQE